MVVVEEQERSEVGHWLAGWFYGSEADRPIEG